MQGTDNDRILVDYLIVDEYESAFGNFPRADIALQRKKSAVSDTRNPALELPSLFVSRFSPAGLETHEIAVPCDRDDPCAIHPALCVLVLPHAEKPAIDVFQGSARKRMIEITAGE